MRRETGVTFPELRFVEELKKWQHHFYQLTGILVYLADNQGNPLTEMDGKPEESQRILQTIDPEQLRNLVKRVSESRLEDQAVEETGISSLHLAAIAVKKEGRTLAVWVMVGDDAEEGNFLRAVDVMRERSQVILEYSYAAADAQAENRRSQFSQKEAEEELRRAETMTEIVQLLDNDDVIEEILRRLLEAVCRYLNLPVGMLLSIHRDREQMDVVAEWRQEGTVPLFERNTNQKCISQWFTDKPVVISMVHGGDGIPSTWRDEIAKMRLKALAVLPVLASDSSNIYVLWGDVCRERVWHPPDIKFLKDGVKILHSILTRRIQKNSLTGSYASLETILDNVGSAIYVKEEETGKMLFANHIMRSTFRFELADGTLHGFITREILPDHGSVEIYHEESQRWYDRHSISIEWVDGRPVRLYALYDITDKKTYQKKIEQQAYSDFLTGLFNRLCCERDLARYVDEAKKAKAEGAILYLDLDDFKRINDGLGHQYGDMLLKNIAHSLQRVGGIEDTCYRMGGDEFVIIVPKDGFPMLDHILGGISEIFSRPWFLKDADYYCTMSMGVACFPSDGDSVQDLVKKADIAMYEAKRGGKNRYMKYREGTDFHSEKCLDMEKNMRDATVGGCREFEVYYQPIIDLRKENSPCTGAEALIRWNNAELGFIPPSEFIPLAEYLGLINPIGNYVLMEACKRCKYWNDHEYPEYKVNVNLSVVQLLQPDIVRIVEEAVRDTGITPANLTLEVTESLAINDMERMKDILNHIKKMGVRIALDDFGTGYSSLNHIREIPFDVIKVDRSFIKDLEEDAHARSFIKMVAQLAREIGVNICMEGVETKEQSRILADMNVDLVQGYYFDRPLSRMEFEHRYMPKIREGQAAEKENGGNESIGQCIG